MSIITIPSTKTMRMPPHSRATIPPRIIIILKDHGWKRGMVNNSEMSWTHKDYPNNRLGVRVNSFTLYENDTLINTVNSFDQFEDFIKSII